jgi:hypothetical protein
MPATDVDFEREFEELVRDLRALPTAAPGGVRERVRALGEPTRPRTLHDLLLSFSWRRSLLVLAPVCVLGLVSAAVIHGVVNSGGNAKQTAAVLKLGAQGQDGGIFRCRRRWPLASSFQSYSCSISCDRSGRTGSLAARCYGNRRCRTCKPADRGSDCASHPCYCCNCWLRW